LHHVFLECVGLVEATWFTGPLDLWSDYLGFEETKELSLEIEKGLLMTYQKFVSEPREGWVRRFILSLKTLAQKGC